MATGLFTLKQVNQAISQGAWSGYIAPKWVEYLVVAGGGGGGYLAGGGGAGGLLTGIVTVAAGTSYSVTVGGGGAGGTGGAAGASGVNTVFGAVSSTGGGAGGSTPSTAGASGGSGGGANNSGGTGGTFGQGISGQGNAGGLSWAGSNYTGGGGGGAGTVGLNSIATNDKAAGNGGAGIALAINGTVTVYAGGGGGAADTNGTGGSGGVGGGGAGGVSRGATGGSGTVNGVSGGGNTGGGGGGYGVSGTGGAGGSGIVVVRYPGNVQFYTGGTVTYSNGYIVHNFTASGTLAPTTPTVVSEYQISRSLRFNSADSTYLSRTATANGSRTTATASLWVKRSVMGAEHRLIAFDSSGSGTIFWLFFNTSDQLQIYTSGTAVGITSTQVFRDPSAWYHIVVGLDTNQATSSDRIKVYVNGSQITAFTGTQTYYTQGASIQFNNTAYTGFIGFNNSATLSGYMTEVNWIDGQQLTPTSFGYVNPTTGVWTPAKFVGGYGTNGAYLNFSDNSNTTAATLGKDYSGNGNNWTPNNFSVTAGVGNDSFVDSPTSYGTDTGVGGEVRGNYATLNPLDKLSTVTAPLNGNLQYNTANSTGLMRGTLGVKSAKWYYEATITAVPAGGSMYIGVKDASDPTMTSSNGLGSNSGTTNEFGYAQSGYQQNNGTATNIGTTLGAGDVLMVAYDLDSGKIWWGKNGTWISSGNPATGANPMFSTLTSTNGYSPAIGYNLTYTDGVVNFNFGQRPFVYTAPSGYKALCTQNLPTPTIGATTATLANKYFDATLYTGTGSTLAVTNAGGFQPDWVWLKNRSNTAYHSIWDAVRGRSAGGLASNDTGAEQASTAGNDFVSFNSNGFSVGPAQNWNVDTSGNTYVGWQWKANGSGSTNTAGTITSTVSANTTSGFSVVTYTGTGANATVGHGLGVAPSMVIVKNRGSAVDWAVWHTSIANTQYLILNSSTSAATNTTAWNSTTPTSTVFSIGTLTSTNTSAATYVAYCFAEVAGYSKFGSYTGNGSTDGVFVFTGMRPAYVMVKSSSNTTTSWVVEDVSRSTTNVMDARLFCETSDAETSNGNGNIDFLSNGFKLRNLHASMNASGSTYIYMAFASNPFKYSLAR